MADGIPLEAGPASPSVEVNSALREAHEQRLRDVARALRDGESIPPLTVRTFLAWFWHSQRRGHWIVAHIRNLLQQNGLITVPDFESTYLDAEMYLQLSSERPASATQQPLPSSFGKSEQDEQKETQTEKVELTDPTYRISKLAAANRSPTFVGPDSSIQEAITLMLANDFSQLPVGTNDREIKGVLSWKSIGTRLGLGQKPTKAREAMEPHAEVSYDASLFTAIPIVVEHDYTLVRAKDRRIVGIITTSDLSLQFQQLSEPFLLLGEIENHIRRIISSKVPMATVSGIKNPDDATRTVSSVADLTFGEYKRLLENPDHWKKLSLELDRSVFVNILEKVRTIRNDVMHFDPDGIEDSALVALRDFSRLLRTLQSVGAT